MINREKLTRWRFVWPEHELRLFLSDQFSSVLDYLITVIAWKFPNIHSDNYA